jgi:hypothetical protein
VKVYFIFNIIGIMVKTLYGKIKFIKNKKKRIQHMNHQKDQQIG